MTILNAIIAGITAGLFASLGIIIYAVLCDRIKIKSDKRFRYGYFKTKEDAELFLVEIESLYEAKGHISEREFFKALDGDPENEHRYSPYGWDDISNFKIVKHPDGTYRIVTPDKKSML